MEALRRDDVGAAQDIAAAYFESGITGFGAYAYAVALADIAVVALRRVRDAVAPGHDVGAIPRGGAVPEEVWSCEFVNDRMFGRSERAFDDFGLLVRAAEREEGAEFFAGCMASLAGGALSAERVAAQAEAERGGRL